MESGSDIYNLNSFFQIQSMGDYRVDRPFELLPISEIFRYTTLPR